MTTELYAWIGIAIGAVIATSAYLAVRATATVIRLHKRIDLMEANFQERLRYPTEQVRRLTEKFSDVMVEEVQAAIDRVEERLDPTFVRELKPPAVVSKKKKKAPVDPVAVEIAVAPSKET